MMIHIFAQHFLNITNWLLRQHIKNYFAKPYHMQWLRSVSRKFLLFKGLTVNEYLKYLDKLQNPLDELSLLIIAHIFCYHVSVVMRDWTWTTGHNYPVNHCAVILAFCGKLSFMLSCHLPAPSDDSDNFCEECPIKLTDDSVEEKIQKIEKSIVLKNEALDILRAHNLLPDNIRDVSDTKDIVTMESPLDTEVPCSNQLGIVANDTKENQCGIDETPSNLLGTDTTDTQENPHGMVDTDMETSTVGTVDHSANDGYTIPEIVLIIKPTVDSDAADTHDRNASEEQTPASPINAQDKENTSPPES